MEVMGKKRAFILPLVFSGSIRSLWERKKVGEKVRWERAKVVKLSLSSQASIQKVNIIKQEFRSAAPWRMG